MVEAMTSLTDKIENVSCLCDLLMDVKGLGKSVHFDQHFQAWPTWIPSVPNFVMGIFGDEFRTVIELTAWIETQMTKRWMEGFSGEAADELDGIKDIKLKHS